MISTPDNVTAFRISGSLINNGNQGVISGNRPNLHRIAAVLLSGNYKALDIEAVVKDYRSGPVLHAIQIKWWHGAGRYQNNHRSITACVIKHNDNLLVNISLHTRIVLNLN